MMTMLEPAMEYAARGWPVVPLWWPIDDAGGCACGKVECDSPGKHPHGRLTPHGLDDATTDPSTIERWWYEVPDLNVGLRTGITFDVLDLDCPEAGHWLAAYAVEQGANTETCWEWGPLSITGNGHHLLYAPTGAGNRARIRSQQGFDWRGRGGYIVAPPSWHYLGHRYRWHENCGPDAPVPPAPAFLVDLVVGRPPQPVSAAGPMPFTSPARVGGWSPAGLISRVATAADGERNSMVNWAAHKLGFDVHNGKVPEADALAALDQIALAGERTGLKSTAVDKTIRSGYSAGRAGRTASPL